MASPPKLSGEHWLPVVGYEDLYMISDQGRVYSSRFDRLLKPGRRYGRNRHRLVVLCHKGQNKTMRVHCLVLEAFVGPRPKGMLALHRDDDAHNNHVSNLYWGTPSQNMYDKVRNGKHPGANKTRCVHDHEYTPENTFINPRGHRECMTCRRLAVRASHRRLREKAK